MVGLNTNDASLATPTGPNGRIIERGDHDDLIEQKGKYLMLHRTVKKNDVNKDKWIGIGGHFEFGESPEECLQREVQEETGLTLTIEDGEGVFETDGKKYDIAKPRRRK